MRNSDIEVDVEDKNPIAEYLTALREGDYFKFSQFMDVVDKKIVEEGKEVSQDTRQKNLQLMLQDADVREADLALISKLYSYTQPIILLHWVDALPEKKAMKWNFVYIAESRDENTFCDYRYITREDTLYTGSIPRRLPNTLRGFEKAELTALEAEFKTDVSSLIGFSENAKAYIKNFIEYPQNVERKVDASFRNYGKQLNSIVTFQGCVKLAVVGKKLRISTAHLSMEMKKTHHVNRNRFSLLNSLRTCLKPEQLQQVFAIEEGALKNIDLKPSYEELMSITFKEVRARDMQLKDDGGLSILCKSILTCINNNKIAEAIVKLRFLEGQLKNKWKLDNKKAPSNKELMQLLAFQFYSPNEEEETYKSRIATVAQHDSQALYANLDITPVLFRLKEALMFSMAFNKLKKEYGDAYKIEMRSDTPTDREVRDKKCAIYIFPDSGKKNKFQYMLKNHNAAEYKGHFHGKSKKLWEKIGKLKKAIDEEKGARSKKFEENQRKLVRKQKKLIRCIRNRWNQLQPYSDYNKNCTSNSDEFNDRYIINVVAEMCNNIENSTGDEDRTQMSQLSHVVKDLAEHNRIKEKLIKFVEHLTVQQKNLIESDNDAQSEEQLKIVTDVCLELSSLARLIEAMTEGTILLNNANWEQIQGLKKSIIDDMNGDPKNGSGIIDEESPLSSQLQRTGESIPGVSICNWLFTVSCCLCCFPCSLLWKCCWEKRKTSDQMMLQTGYGDNPATSSRIWEKFCSCCPLPSKKKKDYLEIELQSDLVLN